MGWEDRDYNTGSGGSDYLANPAAILNLSIPFGTWFGARVRLHFWLLVTAVFGLTDLARGMSVEMLAIGLLALLTALMLHEFGHRWATMLIGGRHDEFLLWPAGGIIFPTAPPGDGPRFLVFVAGMVVNGVLAGFCWLAVLLLTGDKIALSFNPLSALSMEVPVVHARTLAATIFASLMLANWIVLLANLLPYYIFDGGFLLQSILGPFTGGYQSINITCIVGMVLAVPMFAFSLLGHSLLGAIFWALLFSMSFIKRRQLQSTGTSELDDAIAYSAQSGGAEPALKQRWGKRTGVSTTQLMREADADRREQGKIDAILAKVSAQGMASLTRSEQKTLRQATERQKRRSGKR